MPFSESQPRVPAGRREGGQYTTFGESDQIGDLTTTYGDAEMIDAIVAAGAEAYVSGITSERVRAYLEAVGRDDVLSNQEAAMRLSPWSGLKNDGSAEVPKDEELGPKHRRFVEKTDEAPERTYLSRRERLGQPTVGFPPSRDLRLTEEGRQVALSNLLEEAHDRQAFAARQLGFPDDVAEDYAHWIIDYRLAEATRNLGEPDKETLDLLATTLLTCGVEKYLTRTVPGNDEAYTGTARLGRAFEGASRVGADFVRYAATLKSHNAETEAELWDSCARKRMDAALETAWDAQREKVKARFGVEPIDYTEFYDPFSPQSKEDVVTPLNYRPAKENPRRLSEIKELAASGDKQAMATVAAWDAAVKSAGSHNGTMLSDGRASTPFARNHVHRTIELPYRPASMSVEGTRRGARYIYRYSSGLDFYRDGIAQFRSAPSASLNEPVSTGGKAAEFGDLLTGSRAGGSTRQRDAVDPAEVFAAGQRYASAAAVAKALPDDDKGNEELRRLLDVPSHEGIKDKKARAMAIAKDITDARAEGVPEGVIRRLWGPQLIEMTNTLIKARRAQIARAKDEAAAAKARLRDLAAQRRAAQLAH